MSIPAIFPSRVKKEHIKYIKHSEWDIYYSCQNKYPYLVVEYLSPYILNQTTRIDRQAIEDPFLPDPKIVDHCQLSLPIYDNLKIHGLSPGHNAPAGTHRGSPSVWSETFLFSNMTPQEITFNAGIWVVLENWVKRQIRNPRISRVRCITGSPPSSDKSSHSKRVWDPTSKRMITVRVPSYMFKIVLAQPRIFKKPPVGKSSAKSTKDKPNASIKNASYTNGSISKQEPVYIGCFLYPNKAVLPTPDTWNLAKYRVMLPDIEKVTGYRLGPLINRLYNLKGKGQAPAIERLESIENVANLDFNLASGLLIQMERAAYYHHLVYAKSKPQLDKVWNELQENKDRLQITEMKHHAAYRDAAMARLSGKTAGTYRKDRRHTAATSSSGKKSLTKKTPSRKAKKQKAHKTLKSRG